MKKIYSYGVGFSIGGNLGLILGFVMCVNKIASGGELDDHSSGPFGLLIDAIFGYLFFGGVIGAVGGIIIVASMNASIRAEEKRRIQAEKEQQQKAEEDRNFNNALIETQNMFSQIMGHNRSSVINADLILNHINKYDKRCQQMAVAEAVKYENNLYEDFLKTVAGQAKGRVNIKLNEAERQLELLFIMNTETKTFEEKRITEALAKLRHMKDILYKVKPVILSDKYGQCDENFHNHVSSFDLYKLKSDSFSIPYPEALWALSLSLSRDYLTFQSLRQVYSGFCVNPNILPLDIILSEIMLTKNIGGDLWEEYSSSLFEWLKLNANANNEEYYFYLASGLRWMGFLAEEGKLLDLMWDTNMLKSENLRAHYNQIKHGK